MSYCKHPLGPVPADTALACRGMIKKKGKRFAVIADLFERMFDGADIESAYPQAGQWGIHPVRVMMLMILQAMEGLSDRQAAEATGVNLGWIYILRLPMDHGGYDDSTLSKARDRLLQIDASKVFLESVLKEAKNLGLLELDKQRTDSTAIEACVKALNRTELILESVRNVLEDLASADPSWLTKIQKSTWRNRYYLCRPFNYQLPKKDSARIKLSNDAASDAVYILAKITKDKKDKLKNLKSVKILEKVLEQQFSKDDDGGPKQKDESKLPPASERIVSPHEPEARSGHKNGKTTLGFKVHISETCSANAPRLITQVKVETATKNDSLSFPELMKDLCDRGLKPQKVYVDSGYVNVDEFYKIEKDFDIKAISRLANGHTWQSAAGPDFSQSAFKVDWKKRRVVCPAKEVSSKWSERKDGRTIVHFDAEDCGPCPFKENCTKSEARVLTLKPRPIYEMMKKWRKWQETVGFKGEYSVRAGVEGTHSQLISRGGRKARVRSITKVAQRWTFCVVAHNVAKLVDWILEKKIDTTRIGRFEKLVAQV